MTVLNFGQISVNISKTVQDRDILSSVSKVVELKENEKWFRLSVTILTAVQNFLATI